METFDFDYHSTSVQYPESGDRLQLGKSYLFTSSPTAPDQRLLTLYFPGMRNYVGATTGTPDLTTEPKLNFYRLEQFYLQHKLWKSFEYTHVQYGLLVCKFNKPLVTPKRVEGIPGLLEGFSLEFIEIP